ncbi:LysM peptidoglycan-binding domain-containing protein [Rothia nasimurium]|uniref:LysM peptidoglycan-binding domain-containing protein n=1 Tax=Rothia nasimurium TaxID=85336 RepID=UPI003BA33047
MTISPFFGASQRSAVGEDVKGTGADTGNAPLFYTVVAGDTLWSIAEKHLPASATGAEVLAAVYAIQESNQDLIPTLDSLIFSGQTLKISL